MKAKIFLAAIMVVVALVGTVNVNAGITWGYSNINSSRPTAISNYTKDNNTNGSYIYYKSDVGTSSYILTRIFKNMSDGNKTAYTPTVNANKGTRYWMGSYISLPSLVKGDKIDLVIGTQTASSDITYYTWNYN